MPELPEVETTRRGLAPLLLDRTITAVVLRRATLRWPIPPEIPALLPGRAILGLRRRAKYLLLDLAPGSALLHLGMSGSLRIVDRREPVEAHDHVDLVLDDGRALRFTDPRRFGCLLWQPEGDLHPLLRHLGPEPLDPAFTGDHLHARAQGRSAPLKTFLMDQRTVVGVGNIYAAESLFRAGLAPERAAGGVPRARYRRLAEAVKEVLAEAIEAGGTTLRDFQGPDGRPGYFAQDLRVYGRAGAPCPACGKPLRGSRLGARATVWCPRCQR